MSSFNQDGARLDDGGLDPSQLDGWSRSVGFGSDTAVAVPPVAEGGREAMAVLARAIELEIIPRLMLAHRSSEECVPLPDLASQAVSNQDVQAFAKLIMSPDENLARECVEAMRAGGFTIETIYLDLLAPVARYLGDLWDQDLCDFTEVTLGLGRLQQVLRELSPAFGQSNDVPVTGRRVLLLPGPGGQHTFGLVMVAEFFRRAGWDVAGGAWEAGDDPVSMVKREWFDIVGFSVGTEFHLAELAACIKNVRSAALNPAVGIMVGGPVFSGKPELVAQINADIAATDGRQAPILAEKLVAQRTQRR